MNGRTRVIFDFAWVIDGIFSLPDNMLYSSVEVGWGRSFALLFQVWPQKYKAGPLYRSLVTLDKDQEKYRCHRISSFVRSRIVDVKAWIENLSWRRTKHLEMGVINLIVMHVHWECNLNSSEHFAFAYVNYMQKRLQQCRTHESTKFTFESGDYVTNLRKSTFSIYVLRIIC